MDINKMFSQEQNQIAICLLKSDLEQIENDLIAQQSTWPDLDAENDQKCRDSKNALRVVRTLGIEIERLKQENVNLVSKRTQLKRQIDNITKDIQKTRENRIEMENSLKQEEQEMERKIRKYEDSLKEKADRFRQTRRYYDEEVMKGEMEKVNEIIVELEEKANKRRSEVDELRQQLDTVGRAVPDDLLTIIGKKELDDKAKMLAADCEALKQKLNLI